MLNEKFMQAIPDELPKEYPEGIEPPPPKVAQLHKELARRVKILQAHRQQAFEVHQILLPMDDHRAIATRLNLLIEHGFGILTENRLQYELAWVDILEKSIASGIEQSEEARRIKREGHTLHMPDGSHIDIPPQPRNPLQN